MSYREIIFVPKSTQNTNTLCGQNVELLKFKLMVHMVINGL
jgi:hypothetical protein